MRAFQAINVTYEVAKFEYAMSKQTVVNEFKTTETKGTYYALEFVEFLEMICRVSFSKFKGKQMTNGEKIENVMTELFSLFGIKKNEVVIEEEEISESDPDY